MVRIRVREVVVLHTKNWSYVGKVARGLGEYPKRPFHLYRLISGCTLTKDLLKTVLVRATGDWT